MQHLQPISPEELENVFSLIGKDWMLITAKQGEQVNAMTASWGGMGVLWNKPVAFCFIRPQRHTFGMVEASERISLCFFGKEHRAALQYCGTRSGRDHDKLSAAGLTPAMLDGVPCIGESRLVLICRKLYADDLRENAFIDPTLLSNYKDGDFHRMYVLEIEQAYLAKE